MNEEKVDELAELRAKHAAELEKAERELEIKRLLPSAPRFVHRFKDDTHITYANKWAYPRPPEITLARVVELLAEIPPSVSVGRQSGCLSIRPDELQGPEYFRDGVKVRGASMVSLRCEVGRGYGPDWAVEWHSKHPEAGWLKVKVLIGHPRTVRTYVHVRSWHGGEPGEVEKYAGEIPGAWLVTWGGGSRDAGMWSWHFPTMEAFLAFVEREGASAGLA